MTSLCHNGCTWLVGVVRVSPKPVCKSWHLCMTDTVLKSEQHNVLATPYRFSWQSASLSDDTVHVAAGVCMLLCIMWLRLAC